MKIEKIKPIPKYIERKIIAIDKRRELAYNQKRFYAYFTKNDGELVKITVAARKYQDKIYLKQVSVHGIDSDYCFAKDIRCHYIAGYSVGWYDMGLTKRQSDYEDGIWYEYKPEKYFDPYVLCAPSRISDTVHMFGVVILLKYSIICEVVRFLKSTSPVRFITTQFLMSWL